MKRNYLYLLAIIPVIIFFTSCSNENSVEPTTEFPHISYDLLLSEINFARTQPAEYAKLIEEMLPYYSDYDGKEGVLLTYPGEISYLMQEGKVAAIEAIEALKNQAPVSPLTLLTGLNRASQNLCDIQGPTGQVGHTAPDGSTPTQRVEKFCTPNANQWGSGENIAYGIHIARRIIIQLIIDDGVPDRGHRINIYEPAWTHIGFGWGYHKQYKVMCAMNFSYGYTTK